MIVKSPSRSNVQRCGFAHEVFSGMIGAASAGSLPKPVTQACLRPCAPDSLPVMGKYRLELDERRGEMRKDDGGVTNMIINSGHNCWGILWSAVSGLSTAEQVLYGKSNSVDLKRFSPGRF